MWYYRADYESWIGYGVTEIYTWIHPPAQYMGFSYHWPSALAPLGELWLTAIQDSAWNNQNSLLLCFSWNRGTFFSSSWIHIYPSRETETRGNDPINPFLPVSADTWTTFTFTILSALSRSFSHYELTQKCTWIFSLIFHGLHLPSNITEGRNVCRKRIKIPCVWGHFLHLSQRNHAEKRGCHQKIGLWAKPGKDALI